MPDNSPWRPLPLSDAQWPQSIAGMEKGFAGQLNVYRVMAHHPQLLKAWEGLRNHIVLANSLTLEQLEIVTLRVGHRWGARYEWAHHILRGLKAGLSPARIDQSRQPRPSGAPPEDGVLIDAVDALLDGGRLDEAELTALRDLVGETGVFDVMATVGLYTTLAFILKTFDTPIETAILAQLSAMPQLWDEAGSSAGV